MVVVGAGIGADILHTGCLVGSCDAVHFLFYIDVAGVPAADGADIDGNSAERAVADCIESLYAAQEACAVFVAVMTLGLSGGSEVMLPHVWGRLLTCLVAFLRQTSGDQGHQVSGLSHPAPRGHAPWSATLTAPL